LVHQRLDEPEAQAAAAAGHHDRLVHEAIVPLPYLAAAGTIRARIRSQRTSPLGSAVLPP
jgi:hypothetical protein